MIKSKHSNKKQMSKQKKISQHAIKTGYNLCVFVFLFLVSISCKNRNAQQTAITKDETVLKAIYSIIDSIGFVELPYKIYYEQEAEILTDKFGQTRYFYGILPDTTNFYGVLEYLPAGNGIPFLNTYDKNGNEITRKSIIDCNCLKYVGIEIFCDEYVIINKDLTLHYHYSSKHIYEDYLTSKQEALVCEHIEKKGKIDENGNIIFEESIKIPVEDCEYEMLEVATSFYNWYLEFYNRSFDEEKRKRRDTTIILNIVEGENGYCTLENVDNYMQSLRNLGTLTDSFLGKEYQRLLACKNYLETYSWDLYKKSTIYEVTDATPCETTWQYWLHNTQEIIDWFDIIDCKQVINGFEFIIAFYFDKKMEFREYFEAVQLVVKQDGKWFIDEITTRRR